MSVQLSAGVSERLYRLAVGAGARRRRRALELAARIDPADMHPRVELVSRLGIIDCAVLEHAAEGRLDVVGRAAEPVVEIEMSEGGIEVVVIQQPDYAAAEPDAFPVGGRPGQ